MLNKLIDYLDSNKPRPWLIHAPSLDYTTGWNDYKSGRTPCCNEMYYEYTRGYNSAKEDTEYKLSYIERMCDKFVAYIKGE